MRFEIKMAFGKKRVKLHENTIQKIIKKEGLTRKYRIRKLKYKYIKVPLSKGNLVEIDVKFAPKTVLKQAVLSIYSHRLRFKAEILKNL